MSLVGLRAAALAAALVLAAAVAGRRARAGRSCSRVGAWRPLPAVAIVSALAATAWRWSSTALEDIAGAQAVLGPAGRRRPAAAAVAAWLGALAIVLATPNLVEAWPLERRPGRPLSGTPRWRSAALEWLPPLASGASAAGRSWPGRRSAATCGRALVATVVAAALAVGGGAARRRVLGRRLTSSTGLTRPRLGLVSLVAVALDAPAARRRCSTPSAPGRGRRARPRGGACSPGPPRPPSPTCTASADSRPDRRAGATGGSGRGRR